MYVCHCTHPRIYVYVYVQACVCMLALCEHVCVCHVLLIVTATGMARLSYLPHTSTATGSRDTEGAQCLAAVHQVCCQKQLL